MFSGNAGLIVNCGFACTAIYQLYSKQPPRSKTSKQSRPQPEKENEQSTSSKSPPQNDVDVSMLNGEYNSVECETDDSPHFECNNTDVDVITHSNESSFSTSYTVDAAMQPEMLHGGSGPVNETRAISKNPLQVFKEYFANICNLDKSDFKADTKKQSRFDRHVKKVLALFLVKTAYLLEMVDRSPIAVVPILYLDIRRLITQGVSSSKLVTYIKPTRGVMPEESCDNYEFYYKSSSRNCTCAVKKEVKEVREILIVVLQLRATFTQTIFILSSLLLSFDLSLIEELG